MRLCEKIKILRKARGLSQQELGFQLSEDTYGVSRQSISSWENGDSEPKLENIRDLAKVLDVSFDTLLDDTIDLNNNDILTEVLNHSYDKSKDYSYPITYEIFKTNKKLISILTSVIIIILFSITTFGIIGYISLDKTIDVDTIVYEYNNSIVENNVYTPKKIETDADTIVDKLDKLLNGLEEELEAISNSEKELKENTDAIIENRNAINKAIEAANQAKISVANSNNSINKIYLLVIVISIALPVIFFFSLLIAKYFDKSKIAIMTQRSLVIYKKNTTFIKFENIEKIELLSSNKSLEGSVAINLKSNEIIILNNIINPRGLLSFYNELIVLTKM